MFSIHLPILTHPSTHPPTHLLIITTGGTETHPQSQVLGSFRRIAREVQAVACRRHGVGGLFGAVTRGDSM